MLIRNSRLIIKNNFSYRYVAEREKLTAILINTGFYLSAVFIGLLVLIIISKLKLLSFKPHLNENNKEIYNDLFCSFSIASSVGLLLVLVNEIIIIKELSKISLLWCGFQFFFIAFTFFVSLAIIIYANYSPNDLLEFRSLFFLKKSFIFVMTWFFQLFFSCCIWLLLLLPDYPLQVGTLLCTLIIFYFTLAINFMFCKQYVKSLKQNYKQEKDGQVSRIPLLEKNKFAQKEALLLNMMMGIYFLGILLHSSLFYYIIFARHFQTDITVLIPAILPNVFTGLATWIVKKINFEVHSHKSN